MRARIADIVAGAAMMARVEPADIIGPSRFRRLVELRVAVVKVAREHGHSYPAIARALKRDHSTITHYVPNWIMYEKRSPWLPLFVADLRDMVEEYPPFALEEEGRALPVRKAA